MDTILWEKEYVLGYENLDEQHKSIIELYNDIAIRATNGFNTSMIINSVKNLLDYAQMDFSTEERLMILNNYPNFKSHRNEHDFFIRRVEEYLDLLEVDYDSVAVEMIYFMREWITNHFLNSDKELVSELPNLEN
ncbi:MAG: hemerythrin family protein [Candidatus Delongbacteria bacterium]|nr:hemerythrin family protein [Candidatus Delongbacteria bacterium]MBN2833682.1 hemerythrin family protein [Candidatus Delongbacteria bacterium]